MSPAARLPISLWPRLVRNELSNQLDLFSFKIFSRRRFLRGIQKIDDLRFDAAGGVWLQGIVDPLADSAMGSAAHSRSMATEVLNRDSAPEMEFVPGRRHILVMTRRGVGRNGQRRLLLRSCRLNRFRSARKRTRGARNAANVFHQTAILDQVRTVTVRRNFRGQRQRQKQNEKREKTAKAQSVVRMAVSCSSECS